MTDKTGMNVNVEPKSIQAGTPAASPPNLNITNSGSIITAQWSKRTVITLPVSISGQEKTPSNQENAQRKPDDHSSSPHGETCTPSHNQPHSTTPTSSYKTACITIPRLQPKTTKPHVTLHTLPLLWIPIRGKGRFAWASLVPAMVGSTPPGCVDLRLW